MSRHYPLVHGINQAQDDSMRQQRMRKAAPGSQKRQASTATYSVDDLARILGISRNGAYAALRAGMIPHIRIGKRFVIPKAAVDAWFLSVGQQASQDQRARV
jgi:excisionase family DNA binding protein